MKKIIIFCLVFLFLNVAAYSEEAGKAESVNPSLSEIDNYKQKLMSDPENVAIIKGLAADSQVQELVGDPQITAAAKSGDLQALLKNEKFMSVVKSSKFQEEAKKLKQ